MPSKCPDRLKDRTDLYDCFIQPGVKKKSDASNISSLTKFLWCHRWCSHSTEGITKYEIVIDKENLKN